MGEGHEWGLLGLLPNNHNPEQSPSSCPEAGLTPGIAHLDRVGVPWSDRRCSRQLGSQLPGLALSATPMGPLSVGKHQVHSQSHMQIKTPVLTHVTYIH